MQAQVERVTPEMAQEMLGKNGHNRNLRGRLVERLAGAISRGEWVLNGESVKVDSLGRLIDGQHRLNAIVRSGQPVDLLVVRGVSPDAQETVDIGFVRRVPDMLSLRGETNVANLAAGSRLAYGYIHGGIMRNGGDTQPTLQQLLVFIDEYSAGLRESALFGWEVYEAIKMRMAVVVASHFLFSLTDREATDRFFDRLVSGAMLSPGDPILTLRNQVLRDAQRRPRLPATPLGAWTIKAFNLWREGQRADSLKWFQHSKEAKRKKEPFPQIVGFPPDLMAKESQAA